MKRLLNSPKLLAVLSGILIGFSYIPGPIFLSWIAFLPLFYILQSGHSLKKKLIYSWLTQFVLTLIGFHWIAHTIMEFGKLPIYFGALGLMAFASFASLHFCIATFIYEKAFPKKTTLSLFAFCMIFVLSEWFYPMIFPWHMGYTWAPSFFPIKQIADSIGFWGLSLVTLSINYFFYLLIFSKKRIPIFVTGLSLFLILNILGIYKKNLWNQSDSSLNFYVAQANIGNFFKYKAEKQGKYIDFIMEEYLSMTRKDLKEKPADIVLWPETAMPIFINLGRLDSIHSKKIANLATTYNVNIMTGVYSYRGEDIFNSIAHISPEGIVDSLYSKNQLLAFGEYFPGTENNPKLKAYVESLIPAVSHFARGPGPIVFDYNPLIQVGPQICYEGLDPLYVKGSIDNGANLLINVTNDSWFGKTFEPLQHMHMTLARGIEFRRPLVRSTNTGITTAITATGKILEQTKIGEKRGVYYNIPIQLKPQKSIYARIAGILPYILFTLLVLVFIFYKKREANN